MRCGLPLLRPHCNLTWLRVCAGSYQATLVKGCETGRGMKRAQAATTNHPLGLCGLVVSGLTGGISLMFFSFSLFLCPFSSLSHILSNLCWCRGSKPYTKQNTLTINVETTALKSVFIASSDPKSEMRRKCRCESKGGIARCTKDAWKRSWKITQTNWWPVHGKGIYMEFVRRLDLKTK